MRCASARPSSERRKVGKSGSLCRMRWEENHKSETLHHQKRIGISPSTNVEKWKIGSRNCPMSFIGCGEKSSRKSETVDHQKLNRNRPREAFSLNPNVGRWKNRKSEFAMPFIGCGGKKLTNRRHSTIKNRTGISPSPNANSWKTKNRNFADVFHGMRFRKSQIGGRRPAKIGSDSAPKSAQP